MNIPFEQVFQDEISQYFDIAATENWDEIRSIPESIVEHCLSIVYQPDLALKESDRDASRRIVIQAGRAFIESQDWRRCLVLKRIIEASFQNKEGGDYWPAQVLQEALEPILIQKMIDRGIPLELWNDNSMSAIEEAFFISSSSDEKLVGGLLLCCLRMASFSMAPNQITCAIVALRESYAFFQAGEESDAVESLNWGTEIIERLNHQDKISPSEKTAIGSCYKAAATGAINGNYPDHGLSLLHQALQYLPKQGDERADCLLSIGIEFERREKLADAIRLYKLASQIPEIQDETLRGAINTFLSSLRFKLESDPFKMRVDPAMVELLGGPEDYLDILQNIIIHMIRGETVTDLEFAQAVLAIWRHVGLLEKKGQPEEVLFQLVLMLPMCAAIKDNSKRPISLDIIFEKSEEYADKGDDASQMKYELLKEMLQMQEPQQTETSAKIPKLSANPNLRSAFQSRDRKNDP